MPGTESASDQGGYNPYSEMLRNNKGLGKKITAPAIASTAQHPLSLQCAPTLGGGPPPPCLAGSS